MDDMFAVIGIGLSIFAFLLVLLAVGDYLGGQWQTIAQGVTPFILLIVGFALGCFVLVRWMRR